MHAGTPEAAVRRRIDLIDGVLVKYPAASTRFSCGVRHTRSSRNCTATAQEEGARRHDDGKRPPPATIAWTDCRRAAAAVLRFGAGPSQGHGPGAARGDVHASPAYGRVPRDPGRSGRAQPT